MVKVILLKDVPKVGRRYEVKDVSPGYARNFIVSNGLGLLATEKTLKSIEDERRSLETSKRKNQRELEDALGRLASVDDLTLYAKANDDGILFAGIKSEDISSLVKKKLGIEIPAEIIKIDKPIKKIGEYQIEILLNDKITRFRLVVERVK